MKLIIQRDIYVPPITRKHRFRTVARRYRYSPRLSGCVGEASIRPVEGVGPSMLMTTEVTDIGSWQGHWGPKTAIIGRAARGIIACNSRSVVSVGGVMKGRVIFTLKEDESRPPTALRL